MYNIINRYKYKKQHLKKNFKERKNKKKKDFNMYK